MLVLTDEIWNQLNVINDEVNRRTYERDTDQYNKPDFWQRIKDGTGDCEDYALEKRAQMQLLFPDDKDAFRLAYVKTETGTGHAVLTIDTSNGTMVADNRVNGIKVWDDFPYEYQWISREVPGQFMWEKIDG